MGFKSTPAAIGTSNTDVFTMGAGLAGAIVLGIGNQTSNAIAYTVKIFKMATGVTTTIVTSQSLAGNQFKKFEVPIALEAGDKVIMTAASTGIVAFATVTDSSVAPVAKGYTPRGNYSSIATYALNDVVTASDGGSYISTEDNNLGNDPTSSPTFWMVNAEKGDIGTPGDTAMSIVRVVATTNITIASALEDGDTVDGVTLETGDLVLLTGQTAPAENGVYVVPASGAASRHASFNTYDAHCGRYFSVMEGTVGADKLYRCTSDRGGTLGTTGLTISEFSSGGGRELLTATRTYYVRMDGNDSNSGLADTSGGAFKTLQKAWNVISGSIDISGYTVTIKVDDGTYTAGIRTTDRPLVGGSIYVTGNTSNPQNVIIAATSDDAFEIGNSRVVLAGMEIRNSNGSGVHAYHGGMCALDASLRFGACSEAHIFVDDLGNIATGSHYTIAGPSPYHWYIGQGGYLSCVSKTITLLDTPAFSSAFIYVFRGGIAEVNSNTYVGSATGVRFIVDTGGTLNTGSNSLTTLPGNAAGVFGAGFYSDMTGARAPSSFTPTYFGRTTAGSTTYSTQSGSYTRVGPVVFFTAQVTWTAATGTGQAAIGGLPFVASADSMCVFYYDAVSIGSGKQAVLFINSSSSSGGLYGCDAGGGASVGVSVEAAGEIRVSGFYFTSS